MTAETITVLNLGAGVGSAPLVGMQLDGDIHYDMAVFADTQDEPEWVYHQLEWLESQAVDRDGAPIVRVSAGDLMQNLRNGVNQNGGKFVSIPAFTRMDDGTVAMTRRQCTREYKITPVQQYIRQKCFHLSKGQRLPSGSRIVQMFGFSVDEAHRAARLRQHESSVWRYAFPLLDDDNRMRKSECRQYMADWCPDFEWRWSSCRSCPYHSNRQWRELKSISPNDFEAACLNDEALRDPASVDNRQMDNPMFIHRSCVPLRDVDFTRGQPELFDSICDGGCHT